MTFNQLLKKFPDGEKGNKLINTKIIKKIFG